MRVMHLDLSAPPLSSGTDVTATTRRERLRSRAGGAVVLSLFALAWAAAAAAGGAAIAPAVLAVVAALVVARALRWRRAHPPLAGAIDPLEALAQARGRRVFNWAVAGEVAGILVGVNLAANLGYPEWQLPAVMVAVGLHFLPIGWGFRTPAYLVGGVAMTAWALVFRGLSTAPALGPVGAAAILLAMSAWSLRTLARE